MFVLLSLLMLLISIFLILLVLVQRGRGGGLTGALGGMGGQSAFGTKAGDTFTRITYITALVWIFVCMLSIKMLQSESERIKDDGAPTRPAASSGKSDKGGADSPAATKSAGTTGESDAEK
jgi:preprotein translocase subunit SecG